MENVSMSVDLKAMCAANSASAQLQAIAFTIAERGKEIAQTSLDDAAKAEAELDALRAEVHRCLIDIACGMQTEKERRAEAAQIKLHNPADTVDLGGELFTEIEPPTVTHNLIGKPTEQRDERAGGG